MVETDVPTLVARAGRLNIVIEQGATEDVELRFSEKNTGDALDFSGASARMHLRQAVQAEDVLYELSTDNGRIEVQPGGQLGLIVLKFAHLDTSGFTFTRAVYDFEVANSNRVLRYLKGEITIDPNVTRDSS